MSSRGTELLRPGLKVLSSGASAGSVFSPRKSIVRMWACPFIFDCSVRINILIGPFLLFGSSAAYTAELIVNWVPSAARVT